MVNLKGQIVVVTGASRGVGKGIALGLAEAEATVYVTGALPSSGARQSGPLSRNASPRTDLPLGRPPASCGPRPPEPLSTKGRPFFGGASLMTKGVHGLTSRERRGRSDVSWRPMNAAGGN